MDWPYSHVNIHQINSNFRHDRCGFIHFPHSACILFFTIYFLHDLFMSKCFFLFCFFFKCDLFFLNMIFFFTCGAGFYPSRDCYILHLFSQFSPCLSHVNFSHVERMLLFKITSFFFFTNIFSHFNIYLIFFLVENVFTFHCFFVSNLLPHFFFTCWAFTCRAHDFYTRHSFSPDFIFLHISFIFTYNPSHVIFPHVQNVFFFT